MSLKPLDFSKEVEEYEAYQEKTDIKFNKCPHKTTQITNEGLKCQCGAQWYGPREQMLRLQIALQKA